MTRQVEQRVRGQQHGFIRRLISPGDLGERLKPFVFLDYLNGQIQPGTGFGFHPHSGIATLTYQLNADVEYEDTAGQQGIVRATGLEWLRAGGGTWHQGRIYPQSDCAEGFQLWLALPPGVEDGPPEGVYVPPGQVPQVRNVRVLLGSYAGVGSPLPTPSPVDYLDVALGPGESFTHQPPRGHRTAWAFIYHGRVRIGDETAADELLVFDTSEAPVTFQAEGDARVLLGTAVPHDHPLLLGSYSVHTNPASLARGIQRIRDVGLTLRRRGRM